MSEKLLLLVDGVSDVLLVNGVDAVLLAETDPEVPPRAFATPQLDGQTVTHMIGY